MNVNIIGKILGGIFGWAILGPVGAVIGVFIGNFFDQGLKVHFASHPKQHTQAVQKAFFTATFSVMGHLAKADGRVVEHEIQAARKIMKKLDLDETLKKEAVALFNQGKSSDFNLHSVLTQLWHAAHNYPDLLKFFVEIQLEAALADGTLQAEEERVLLVICQILHIDRMEFEQLKMRFWAGQAFYTWSQNQWQHDQRQQDHQRHYRTRSGQSHYRQYGAQQDYRQPLQNAYGVLGVSPQASVQDIKKAYRKLMNQHHPDKLVARGLPDKMLKLAKEKTQQITAAYNLIREAKGFR